MIVIPGELIALFTFPGVIIHEIAHRFFCDITNTPVCKVVYFAPLEKTSGYVIHKKTDRTFYRFLIATGPLLFNSLLCMLLTIPMGIKWLLGTEFINHQSTIMHLIFIITTWIGYSIGFHAMPSNQDVANLVSIARWVPTKILLFIFTKFIAIFNISYIGQWLQGVYAFGISLIIPKYILIHLFKLV